MPTFDGGHYFLTCLMPIRTDTIEDDHAATSPVHALRKRLSLLPTGAEIAERGGGASPFARNRRTHFARFVVIDDVAYNGRDPRNALWTTLRRVNLTIAGAQDHLSCPFLLFAADFDAASGLDSDRDSYLVELWRSAGDELRGILEFCVGFDGVKDEKSFAAYVARCQIETTMSFNDYYADGASLPTWAYDNYKWAAVACGVLFAASVIATGALAPREGHALPYAFALTLLSAAALAIIAAAAYASVMRAGAQPFPAAPDSGLPHVLKALYLQRAFTRFAIDNQIETAGQDDASARDLYDNFARFVAEAQPSDLTAPTQASGVIGL